MLTALPCADAPCRVFTLLVGGIISAAIFAWGTFAPSKMYGSQILQYQRQLQYMTDQQLAALNAGGPGAPSSLAPTTSAWAAMTNTTKSHVWPSTTIPASELLPLVNTTSQMYLDNSVVQYKP